MNYLKYIEHAAENLQFFLWFHDYNTRFNSLSESERVLSPQWTQAQAEAEATTAAQQTRANKTTNVDAHAILQGTSFDDGNGGRVNEKGDPFHTPPASSFDESRVGVTSDYGSSTGDDTLVSSTAARGIASQAFGDAGMKWQPCTLLVSLSYYIPILVGLSNWHTDFICSHHATLPRRDLSHHHRLHRRQLTTRTQPLVP